MHRLSDLSASSCRRAKGRALHTPCLRRCLSGSADTPVLLSVDRSARLGKAARAHTPVSFRREAGFRTVVRPGWSRARCPTEPAAAMPDQSGLAVLAAESAAAEFAQTAAVEEG